MSLARHPIPRPQASSVRPAQAGYTLLEVMVVVALMTIMSLMLAQGLKSTSDIDDFLAASSRAAERGQKTIYTVTGLVSESRKLYENDATGVEYLNACDLAAMPVAPGARLPVIDSGADLHADEIDEPKAGNMLLFVREINASTCVADKKEKRERWIDTYRMIAIYPSIVQRGISQGSKESRDLVIWRSVAYPSYRQLMEIGDKKERETVVKDLVSRYGFRFAWDPSATADSAFYELESDGDIAKSPESSPTIEEDEWLSERGRLVYANVRLAETSADSHARRAVLTAHSLNAWKPHGFEVKIGGDTGSRKVWLHTVVESAASAGRRMAVQEHTTMAHVRDF